jgi:hypothetical protein
MVFRKRDAHLTLLTTLLVLPLSPLGCSPQYEKGARFRYQDEVGFAKVSVVSVAPWSEVAPVLVTNFKLTPEDAVKKAAQSGRTVDEVIANAISVALTSKLTPTTVGSTTADTGNSTSPSGAGDSTTDDSTDTTASADDAGETDKGDSTTPGTDSSNKTSSSQNAANASAAAVTAMPALTQYRTGAALYQEVMLTPTYIDHVAGDYGATPYFVTMDVGLFPASPKAEVNALVTVAFVGTDAGGNLEWSPTVVPVMSSEDLEINEHSRSVHNTLNVALEIAGTAPNGMGSSGKFNDAFDKLSKLGGKDVNSLQLVSSASPDSLIVRFGASYGVKTEYALYPQARRVHCLVWVPKDKVSMLRNPKAGGHLFALANANFRYTQSPHPSWDAFAREDGAEIPVRSGKAKLATNLCQFSAETGLSLSDDDLKGLWGAFQTGDTEEFNKILRRNGLGKAAPTAWAEMARLGLHSPWSFSEIHLPKPAPPSAHRFLAVDDGKQISLTLPTADFPAEPGCWSMEAPAVLGDGASILPKSVARSTAHRTVALTFASLRQIKPKVPDTYQATLAYVPGCRSDDPQPDDKENTKQLEILVAKRTTATSAPKGQGRQVPKRKGGQGAAPKATGAADKTAPALPNVNAAANPNEKSAK